jgi:threonine/homoserine/homoserine lactone efflux protein
MLILTLFQGIAVGIVIALPVGPVGVLCVRRTLFEGLALGLVSGLGAACADAIFAVIAGFGLTFVRDWLLRYEDWLSAGGGVFLLYLGIGALMKRRAGEPEPLAGEALFGSFASAFALTITNPITILAFAAIFARVGSDAITSYAGISVLVGGVFLGSAVWWLGLSLGISGLRRRTGHFTMGWINRISGAILTLSGAALLISAILSLARIGR